MKRRTVKKQTAEKQAFERTSLEKQTAEKQAFERTSLEKQTVKKQTAAEKCRSAHNESAHNEKDI